MTNTEENILAGALEEFSKKGFSDTTIENIALNCGINKVTIFRHFESKENLFQKVLKTYLQGITLPDFSLSRDTEPEKRIEELCIHLFHFAFRQIHVIRIEIQADGILENEKCRFIRIFSQRIRGCMAECVPQAQFPQVSVLSELLASYILWYVLEQNKDHNVWVISEEILEDFQKQIDKNIRFIFSTLE